MVESVPTYAGVNVRVTRLCTGGIVRVLYVCDALCTGWEVDGIVGGCARLQNDFLRIDGRTLVKVKYI